MNDERSVPRGTLHCPNCNNTIEVSFDSVDSLYHLKIPATCPHASTCTKVFQKAVTSKFRERFESLE